MRTGAYMSTKHAALVSGLRPQYLAQLCREGKLKATRSGKSWMVLDESLQEFLGDRVARRDGLVKTLSQQRKDEYVASMSASRDAFGIDQVAQSADQSRMLHTLYRVPLLNRSGDDRTLLWVAPPLPPGISLFFARMTAACVSIVFVVGLYTLLHAQQFQKEFKQFSATYPESLNLASSFSALEVSNSGVLMARAFSNMQKRTALVFGEDAAYQGGVARRDAKITHGGLSVVIARDSSDFCCQSCLPNPGALKSGLSVE